MIVSREKGGFNPLLRGERIGENLERWWKVEETLWWWWNSCRRWWWCRM